MLRFWNYLNLWIYLTMEYFFMKGQFPAVIHLTDLNGQNGFKIDGEN